MPVSGISAGCPNHNQVALEVTPKITTGMETYNNEILYNAG
jgi:hypothetical protein